MRITKRLKSDYSAILKAKIYMLLTRSIWIYLICMFVIASVLPLPSVSILFSGMIYFLSLLILVILPTYHFSAVRLASTLKFDADAVFSEVDIVLRHRNKDLVETKDWTWISKIAFTPAAVVLETRQYPGFMIFLRRNGLTGEEMAFLNQMNVRIRQR